MGSAAVVLDASAAIELVTGSSVASRVGALIRGRPVTTPAHFDGEALAGIRRLVLRKKITPEEGSAALLRIETFEADRVPLAPLLVAAFALRDRFGAYDALYAVLAKRESALLVTVDASFARASEGFVEVELART